MNTVEISLSDISFEPLGGISPNLHRYMVGRGGRVD